MQTTILDSTAARKSITQINENTKIAGKSMEKISLGEKIYSAQEDAAAWSVSERLRAQMKNFSQLIQNVQNGSALLKTAEGGVKGIVDEITNLKELAINAATETNTDEDRAALQKVFLQGIGNINDIASTTDYNGKNLLDGTFGGWDFTTYFEPVMNVEYEIQTETVTETVTHNITEEIEVETEVTVSEVITETTEIPVTHTETIFVDDPNAAAPDTGNVFNITSDGVFNLPSDFSGTINVGAKNVKIVGNGTNSNTLINVTASSANLWIENLNISNSDDLSAIKFSGSGNVLTVSGTNNLSGSGATAAVINVGGGLTIQGTDLTIDGFGSTSAQGATALNVNHSGGAGAGIGSDGGKGGGDINIGLGVAVFVDYTGTGAGIGSGAGGRIGNFQLAGGNGGDNGKRALIVQVTHNISGGNAIGYGEGGSAGSIKFGSGTGFEISVQGDENSPIIRGGSDNARQNAVIGSTSTAVITLNGNNIGSGSIVTVQENLEIPVLENVSEPSGDAGYSEGGGTSSSGNVAQIASTITITDSYRTSTTTRVETSTRPTTVTQTVVTGTETEQVEYVVENRIAHTFLTYEQRERLTAREGLKIHSGDGAFQSISINFQDMHTKSMGLDSVDISTRANALAAIEVLERALEYVLNEAANIGSFLSRFEHTASVLTTMNENVQASESAIRDADLAKEITNYTRVNLLSQSAQAMLAHANQNSEDVIGLIR